MPSMVLKSPRSGVLHSYWHDRAMHAFEDSGMATKQIDRPENRELNQVAYIKVLRTQLQLLGLVPKQNSSKPPRSHRVLSTMPAAAASPLLSGAMSR